MPFSERSTKDEKIPKPVSSSVDFALSDEVLSRRENIDIVRHVQAYNIVDHLISFSTWKSIVRPFQNRFERRFWMFQS